jgi:hypothetical protein
MKEFASKERKSEGRMKEQVLKLKHFGRKTLKEHESNERKFKGLCYQKRIILKAERRTLS